MKAPPEPYAGVRSGVQIYGSIGLLEVIVVSTMLTVGQINRLRQRLFKGMILLLGSVAYRCVRNVLIGISSGMGWTF